MEASEEGICSKEVREDLAEQLMTELSAEE